MSEQAFDLQTFLDTFPEKMSMRFACLFLDMDNTRISRLATEGKIPGTKSSSGSWLFKKSELAEWKIANKDRRRASKSTGKSYVFKITGETLEEMTQKLDEVTKALERFGLTVKPLYDPSRRKPNATPRTVTHRTRIADPANIQPVLQGAWKIDPTG